MSCSVCKSKTHNKRKCPDKAQPPPPNKSRVGRPGTSENNGTSIVVRQTTENHHDTVAQPSRAGRGGRVIRSGGGSRGGARGRALGGSSGEDSRGKARGRARGGARGGLEAGSRGFTTKVSQGMGVLIDREGYAYTNVPGSSSGPTSIRLGTEDPSTQASTCAASN
ncbi:hypothetical protein RND81_08G026000 [Saponaria officinalis]|uniref:Uncharacterized protein n=1 Tax=Saponaria officinalis TaxID=3572 RepID=A0AAW1J2H0_SAPOF